jgi:hypothetical protein
MEKKNLSNIKYISFNYSGWDFIYYLGCIKALHQLDKHLHKRVNIYVCSGGIVPSILFLNKINPDNFLNNLKSIIKELKLNNNILSRFYINKNIIKILFDKYKNKIKKIKKIKISVSKFMYYKFENIIINNLTNINDFYIALLQTNYVPFINGFFPLLNGCVDGGLTNNIFYEKINKKNVLNFGVSKLQLYTDICFNGTRFGYDPPCEEDMNTSFNCGYNDTIKYFNY